ncbi:MAG: hypothetical protein KIT25_04075 [Enhydrobacter sp.]|nr:MAG: hypothetical protein KIT25_04075 [Enhydrobacter sp.]
MQFFPANTGTDGRDDAPRRPPLGLRTILTIAVWFGAALLLTDTVGNVLRISQTTRPVASYEPPPTPPVYRGAIMPVSGR